MKALILDMYGVILKDPEGGFLPFVNYTFPEITREQAYFHWNKADVGEITSLDLFRYLGFTGDLGKLEKEYLDTIEIDETFHEFASIMKNRCKLAIISNDLSEWSYYLRKKHKINDYFDVITISGDIKIKKPEAKIFTLTIEKLGVAPSDCIYVDDRRFNLEAAQSLGIDTILFNTRNVEYDGKTVYSFAQLTDMLT